MEIEYVRIKKCYATNKSKVEYGILTEGSKLDIDSEYTTFLCLGDTIVELSTSEWGTAELISKIEMYKQLEGKED
jgi:hypothetical protein